MGQIGENYDSQRNPMSSNSRSPPLELLQQPAKPFTTNDLTVLAILLRDPTDRHISDSLVRSFGTIMGKDFRDNVGKIFLAKNHESIR